jgi:thymidylate synthase
MIEPNLETRNDELNPDDQYNRLVSQILLKGTEKHDRTGVGTRGIFGHQMRFDIRNGKIPLLTSKKVFTKAIIHELLWMLSGDTNIRYLKDHNVSIWDSWVKPETAEYRWSTWKDYYAVIKQRGLIPELNQLMETLMTPKELDEFHKNQTLPWSGQEMSEDHPIVRDIHRWFVKHDIPQRTLKAGELPKIYQHQWRRWEDTRLVPIEVWDTNPWYKDNGFVLISELYSSGINEPMAVLHREIDQIQKVIDTLKTNPDSRRIVVSAWNAAEIEEMALLPCHVLFQFYTRVMGHGEREQWLEQHRGREAGDQFRKELGEVSQSNDGDAVCDSVTLHALLDHYNVPRRALSCQLYQR